MALPINIEELIHGDTIEWERLELKKGWNPEVIIRSMCAFANDLHNWGGGYIIIGLDENKGQPLLPPEGLHQNQLDPIQKELLKLGHKITPTYFPISQPYRLNGKHILVIWCPAGDNRPYEAPESLSKGAKRSPYVRIGSNSIIARGETLRQLQELAARIPFDDRTNNRATLKDLDLGLIRAHLQEVKSDLFEESASMPFAELCRTMLIAKGPNEDIRPTNVGLLFFCKNPEQYFPRTRIEVVVHKDDSGKKFTEHYFEGPIQHQLRDTLSFLKTHVLNSVTTKMGHKAEADVYYNYPFEAIEEALSNAVYHKSYELGAPIEIQVFLDSITILSHPGPVPPVTAQIMATQKRIIAREYRNRRIGDFLKELHLTEARGTGFPTIYNSMKANGSPEPKFETDEKTYVLVTLPAHQKDQASDQVINNTSTLSFNNLEDITSYCDRASDQASDRASDRASDQASAIVNEQIHTRVNEILAITESWIKREELFGKMDLSNHSNNRKKYLDPLIEFGWIEMEYPENRTHPKQRYRITKPGMILKQLIDR